jgi:hypothetical protein
LLVRRELAQAHTGRAVDGAEQGRLRAGNAELVRLATEMAVNAEEDGAQPVGDGKGVIARGCGRVGGVLSGVVPMSHGPPEDHSLT